MVAASSNIPDALAVAAARRVIDGASRVADSFETAEIFPSAAYTDESFWRFERWAIFEREWLCIGHANQIPNPGDHFTISVIDEPLIVSRDDAGQIHVLSAICQHRGHPLLAGLAAAPGNQACNNARLLICPYHSWSYRLDGTLHAAPGMSQTAPLSELRKRIRLPSVRHTLFEGLIFVNFDPEAAPLEPSLTKMHSMIKGFGLADLMPAAASSTVIQSNWKLYQENALEPYHTDTVHRHSHNPAPAHLSKFYDFAATDGAIFTTTGFSRENELFATDNQPRLPQIEGLSEEQKGRLLFIAVLPVLFLLFEPGSVLVTLAFPHGPDSMTLKTFSLYPTAAMHSPDFADVVAAQAAALRDIVAEDITTQEALQHGHRSRFTPAGTLSWLEATIPQMNHWLVSRYRAALSELPAERITGERQ